MKYIILLGDGMADRPVAELGGKTPLEAARTPNMDMLAKKSLIGLVKTVPKGMPPGSDVANLSVMGYDTEKYYTGRSPLEAISMGIKMADSDIAFRCNLVTLSGSGTYEDRIMEDYSAGEISTGEAADLIKSLAEEFNNSTYSFYPGISYRHCLIWRNGLNEFDLTPPHDITGKCIKDFLPKGDGSDILLDYMKKSMDILKNHPVNRHRISQGKNPADSIWLWGNGSKPILTDFKEKTGLTGSVISAVDLIKGIGISAGMNTINVPGATGNIHTNFEGKADAAISELKNGYDFVYLHIEAPDECGHQGQIYEKVKAIEYIDQRVLGQILEALKQFDRFKLMILPDHPTPLDIRTHTSDPVPFMIYSSQNEDILGLDRYTERLAQSAGVYVEPGHCLIDLFINGRI